MDLITRHLTNIGFTKLHIEQILQRGLLLELKKGQRFSESNKVCDEIGVIFNGILYGYYIDTNGRKKISQFFFCPYNYLVVDYKSYSQRSISNVTIEAIENSKLLVFERNIINQLNEMFPELIQIQQIMAKQLYVGNLNLIHLLQTCNALERIKILKNNAPELFAKVPYSYLASYLGIHRNTFNTAMKKL